MTNMTPFGVDPKTVFESVTAEREQAFERASRLAVAQRNRDPESRMPRERWITRTMRAVASHFRVHSRHPNVQSPREASSVRS
jgi:hypothetical protein